MKPKRYPNWIIKMIEPATPQDLQLEMYLQKDTVSTNCPTQPIFWPFYNKKLKLFILVLSQTGRQAIYFKKS